MSYPRLTTACLTLLACLIGSAPASAVSPPLAEAAARKLVKGSDRNTATAVSVELHDHHYEPRQLSFEKARWSSADRLTR